MNKPISKSRVFGAGLSIAIRTDKPEAELYVYKNNQLLAQLKWPAHLKLAETIHQQIQKLLMLQGLTLKQLGGVVCFRGPGSFTGLRIGASTANALAYAQRIPVVGAAGPDWRKKGLADLQSGQNDRIVIPAYGAQPNISKRKH